MLAVWTYIESDFRRDYGIILTDELPHMSWRCFCALLDGLTPYGALGSHYESALKKQREEEERESNRPSTSVNLFWTRIASVRPAND